MHIFKTCQNFYQDLSTENYKQEVQNLRKQLELVSEERDELRVSNCWDLFSCYLPTTCFSIQLFKIFFLIGMLNTLIFPGSSSFEDTKF